MLEKILCERTMSGVEAGGENPGGCKRGTTRCFQAPSLYLKLAGHMGADALLTKPYGRNRFEDALASLLGS